ncbi:MAG: tryptophan synthase subunit alpha [bacterium]|nr:tryptophan synthase subunit alpha [bacterium]
MSAIDDRFSELRAQNRKAFIPFVTAGDPNLEVTARALKLLSASGCAIGEVGIPYSDPIADGPVIQASYTRALDAGTKLHDIFAMVAKTIPELSMPLVSMVSYSIIQRIGAEAYLQQAKAAGFSGAIVPDLLVEEAGSLRSLCRQHDFSLIHLVTPTTPRERMLRIAESSSGFIYFVSVTGITGERNELPSDLLDQVAWLRERTELPICIGFGISTPEHVRRLAPVADGLIVGSAIVRRLSENQDADRALANVEALVREMIDAMMAAC